MDLFIESPQLMGHGVGPGSRLFSERPALPAAVGNAAEVPTCGERRGLRKDTSRNCPQSFGDGLRTRDLDGIADPRSAAGPREIEIPAADAYQAELAYARRCDRRRKAAQVIRMFLLAIFIPLAVVAVFVASYALTYILNGATFDEVLEALLELAGRIEAFLRQLMAELRL